MKRISLRSLKRIISESVGRVLDEISDYTIANAYRKSKLNSYDIGLEGTPYFKRGYAELERNGRGWYSPYKTNYDVENLKKYTKLNYQNKANAFKERLNKDKGYSDDQIKDMMYQMKGKNTISYNRDNGRWEGFNGRRIVQADRYMPDPD